MGKGLKVYECYSDHQKRDVRTNEISEEDRNKLKCIECGAEMTYTETHFRFQGTEKEQRISRYFRLQTNADHDENCQHTLRGKVNHILSQSKALANGFEILINTGRKLRLSVDKCKDEFNKVKEKSKKKEDDGMSFRPNKSNVELPPYLKTAQSLVELFCLLEEDDQKDFKKTFEIYNKGKAIRWSSFFYEKFDDLAKKSRMPDHPVAVVLQPREIKEKNGEKKIQCFAAKLSEGNIVIPWILCDDQLLLEEIMESEDVLVIAIPEKWKKTHPVFRHVAFRIYRKAQCAEFKI